jgi:hypothetical protein
VNRACITGHAKGYAKYDVSELELSHTRLYGVTLLLARAATFSVIAFIVVMLCVSIPVHISDMSVICTSAICPVGRLTPSSVAALRAIGISAHTYVYGTLLLDCVSVVAWLGARSGPLPAVGQDGRRNDPSKRPHE